MSLHFYYSDNLATLAQKLQKNTTQQAKKHEGLFYQPTVIVPNRNMRRWIELYMANPSNGTDGIIANWKFSFLESFLIKILKVVFPKKSIATKETSLVDIYTLLDQSRVDNDSVFKSYYEKNEKSKLAQENLKLELVEKIISLFDDYERHRHNMLEFWRSNEPDKTNKELSKKNNLEDIYIAQKSLFFNLFNLQKKSHYKLYELLDIDHNKDEVQTFHLFGLSQVSSLHLDIINKLGEKHDIHYYINFLGHPYNKNDLKISQDESQWSKLQKSSLVSKPTLSKSHLSPSFEMIELMRSSNPNADHYFKFSHPKNSTSLECIQSWVQGHFDTEFCDKDQSVSVIAQPTKQKEIQAIYSSIIENLKENPGLKLSDIAVLIPSMDTYRVNIISVFEAGIRGIDSAFELPYNFSDYSSGKQSSYFNAVLTLCRILVSGNLKRREVIDLIKNPCFCHAHNISGDEGRWLYWIEKLNMFDNDSADHPQQTWDNGINRLLLGQVMETRFGNQDHDFYELPPYQVDSSQSRLQLSAFIDCIKSLEQTIEDLKKITKPATLVTRIQEHINRHLQVPEELTKEFTVQRQITTTLSSYKSQKNTNKANLTLETIYLIIKKMEASVNVNKGQYLTGGITISSLQPMRPIPFKIIYIVGLNAQSFPGKNDTSLMNLRNLQHEPGDIGMIERNTLLFYETILAAKHKVYFSYQSIDLQKDTKKMISPIVEELLELIKNKKHPQENESPDITNNKNYFALLSKKQDIACNPFEILQDKINLNSTTLTVKQLSTFLNEPTQGILNTRYKQRFPYLKDQLIDINKPLFTQYKFNDVIRDSLKQYFQNHSSTQSRGIDSIVKNIYHTHVIKGNSPGKLLQKADLHHLQNTFLKLHSLCEEILDKDIELHLDFSSMDTKKTLDIHSQESSSSRSITFHLEIPIFQYKDNRLKLLQLQSIKKNKEFIPMFIQGLLFFYLQPDEFSFDRKSIYTIDCSNIHIESNNAKAQHLTFKVHGDQIKEYIQEQVEALLLRPPDWLDYELLVTIDKTLAFSDFKNNQLKEELEATYRHVIDHTKTPWRSLVEPVFPKEPLSIIKNRWNLFSRALDGR